MKRLTLLIGLFLLSIVQVFAQGAYQGRQDNYWAIGFQVNSMNYFGDLNPKNQYASTKLSFTRPGLFINATKRFGTNLRVRASLGYGRVTANDFQSSGNFSTENEVGLKKMARYGRNLHFRNDIKELAVVATYDFGKSYGRFYRRRAFSPYAMLGVAVFHHNPKAQAPDVASLADAGKWVALQPLGTEGQGKNGYNKKYSLIQPAVILGAGIRLRITDRIDISGEIGWRFLFTDYLDDVSGKYADLADLDTELARRMSDRSGEATDALSGKARDFAAITPTLGGLSPNYGGAPPYPNVAGQNNLSGYTRLGSYGLKGDVRGTGSSLEKDNYITAGFHLNYILASKRHPRYSGN